MESTPSAFIKSIQEIDYLLFLEYLKVLVWPIITGGFIYYFRNEIRVLIKKGLNLKFPGGPEIGLGIHTQEDQNIEQSLNPSDINKFDDISQKYEDQIKELGNNKQKLETELINTTIYLEFERIYNAIFGSQILLLKVLKSNQGINNLFYNSLDIVNYFVNVKVNWQAELQNWTSSLYMKFLIESNLVNYNSSQDKYYITDKGIAFLSYIAIRGYNETKPL